MQSPSFFGGKIVPERVLAQLFALLDARTYTSGGTWNDISGNGRNFTISGAVHQGNSFRLNGISQYFIPPATGMYATSGSSGQPMTYEMIYLLDEDGSGAVTPGNNSLFGNTRGPGDTSFQLESIGAAVSPTRGIRQGGYNGAGGFPITDGTSVPSGKFNHMIMSCQPNGTPGFWLQNGVFYDRTWHNGWSGSYTNPLNMGIANTSGGQGSVKGNIALHAAYPVKITKQQAWQNWLSVQPYLEELNG